MDIIGTGIIIFLVVAFIYVITQILCTFMCRNVKPEVPQHIERRITSRIRIDPSSSTTTNFCTAPSNGVELIVHCVYLLCWCFCNCICQTYKAYDHHRELEAGLGTNDRQGSTFSQAIETGRDNRCNDIFFIEPNSLEAARIRAQLEKDDKELPSYDEVMRIANLSTPTAAPAASNLINSLPVSNAASSSSVNLRPLTPPPYTLEPIVASVVLPITTPLRVHTQQNTQSS